MILGIQGVENHQLIIAVVFPFVILISDPGRMGKINAYSSLQTNITYTVHCIIYIIPHYRQQYILPSHILHCSLKRHCPLHHIKYSSLQVNKYCPLHHILLIADQQSLLIASHIPHCKSTDSPLHHIFHTANQQILFIASRTPHGQSTRTVHCITCFSLQINRCCPLHHIFLTTNQQMLSIESRNYSSLQINRCCQLNHIIIPHYKSTVAVH